MLVVGVALPDKGSRVKRFRSRPRDRPARPRPNATMDGGGPLASSRFGAPRTREPTRSVSPGRPGGSVARDMLSTLGRQQRPFVAVGAALTVVTAALEMLGANDVVRFAVAGLALAALAAVVGQAIEAVGEHLGPGATGLLQSTLGNLPELFVGVFALRAGLDQVVRAALVGSILGNAVLVLGCAFVAGGLRHGPQRFDPAESRLYGSLLLVAVAALLVPTLAHHLDTPAAAHTTVLSDICAGVLLLVYACSVPFTLRLSADAGPAAAGPPATAPLDPAVRAPATTTSLRLSLGLLIVASLAAGAVSDWFVNALEPATHSLGLTQTFTGLVVVALASNAVEHAVGVRFALKAKPAYAMSTTLSSPLQVALLLVPVLVLVSNVVGPTPMTLVFPALLVVALGIATLVVVTVIYDGEYTWIEGVALIGLYIMLATGFWWG
jgi:Ca2+:H+ antiporter